MRYIIKTQECGYLFKNGILKKLLFAGKHQVFGLLGEKLVVTEMTGKVDTVGLPVEVLMENPQFRERVIRVQIPDDCIGLHLVNGVYKQVLTEGEALYWNVFEKNEIRLIDVTGTEMTREQIPAMYRHLIPARLYKRLAVGEGETGLLYIDGQFEKQLSPGTYFYWIYAHEVSMKLYSLKVQQLEISGQEILTADKVGVRLNILCSYRITDPLGLVQKTDNVGNLLYTRIQLLAREYIGGFRLDELLARKEEISGFLMKGLRDAQARDHHFVQRIVARPQLEAIERVRAGRHRPLLRSVAREAHPQDAFLGCGQFEREVSVHVGTRADDRSLYPHGSPRQRSAVLVHDHAFHLELRGLVHHLFLVRQQRQGQPTQGHGYCQ